MSPSPESGFAAHASLAAFQRVSLSAKTKSREADRRVRGGTAMNLDFTLRLSGEKGILVTEMFPVRNKIVTSWKLQ